MNKPKFRLEDVKSEEGTSLEISSYFLLRNNNEKHNERTFGGCSGHCGSDCDGVTCDRNIRPRCPCDDYCGCDSECNYCPCVNNCETDYDPCKDYDCPCISECSP